MAVMDDFEQTQLDLMQRRKKAQEGQEFRPLEGQMVSGRYVAPHFTQILAEGLRGYGNIQKEKEYDQQLKSLRDTRQQALSDAVKGFQTKLEGTPAVAPTKTSADMPSFDEADAATLGGNSGYSSVTGGQKAIAPDAMGAYTSLLRAPDATLRSAGMTGMVSEQKIKADNAQNQRHLDTLANTKTPQEAFAAGVPADKVKAYYESSNYGRTKAGRPIEVEGPNGVKMIQQVDEYGTPMGPPVPGYMPAQAVNTGNAVTFAKPVQGQSFDVNMSPGDKAKLEQQANQFQQSEARAASQFAQGQNAPVFNADAGGFVYKPTAQAPQGSVVKVEGVGNKPLTEGQAKAVAYGARMQNSDKILNDLGLSGTNAIIPGANNAVMNPLLSKNQQKAVQAQRDFVNATLRRESGAVISDQEFANAAKQYFPQVGDTPEVIAQKAQNRKIAIGGIQADIPQSSRDLPKQIIQNSTPKPTGSGNIDSLLDKYK
jgi:hypothetical protein